MNSIITLFFDYDIHYFRLLNTVREIIAKALHLKQESKSFTQIKVHENLRLVSGEETFDAAAKTYLAAVLSHSAVINKQEIGMAIV